MDTLMQDLRYALRTLARKPGFTVLAVLTLALGLGANTALFSVVNAVLLNPLPYPHPEQLVTIHESKPNFDSGSISYPNFLDWQKNNRTFSSMAVRRAFSFSLTGAGDPERVQAFFVTYDFFRQLGVNPSIGRSFNPDDDRKGAAPVALISTGLWKRKFGAGADVLGKSITLDGKGYTVVGVIPETFDLLMASGRDVYVPLIQWTNPLLLNRGAGLGIHGVGRLKPGVTIDQARADMARVTRDLTAAYPDTDKGIGATLRPLRQDVVGDVQPYLLVLFAAVGLVLLIACVNVANLLLARASGRAREFAIRIALGAGQGRVIRQLLTESVLLAVTGGALGLLLARWCMAAALARVPGTLPRANEVGLDGRVLIFTTALTLLAGILFGLAPALKTVRPALNEVLQQGGRGASGARHRAQGTLVTVEMALALVLLIGAGLMVRTLAQLWGVNPGFDAHNVLTFGVSLDPSMNSASPEAVRNALRSVNDRIGSLPGVKGSSLSWGAMPLSGDDEDLFWLDGEPKPASTNDMHWALSYVVQEDYLKLMGIPLERGRFFTAQDNERAPHVIVVDDVFARKFFGGESPIGKRVHLDNKGGLAEIVGVVGHVKQWGLDSDDTQPLRAQLYFPYMQLPDNAMQPGGWSGTGALVRFEGDSGAVTKEIQTALKEMNGNQVMFGAQTMEGIIAQSLAARQFSMILLGAFAALAMILASVGIYGVVSYLVGQRTHEIGVRMALGAKRVDVFRLVLGQGSRMALLGVGSGLLIALGLTRLMTKFSLLFGVSATDPLTFAAVSVMLVAVAMAACYVPARRATRVDPMVALRCE